MFTGYNHSQASLATMSAIKLPYIHIPQSWVAGGQLIPDQMPDDWARLGAGLLVLVIAVYSLGLGIYRRRFAIPYTWAEC